MKMSKVMTGTLAFAASVIMGAAPMTAFAQVPECICEEKCVEDVKDGINEDCVICKEDISMCEGVETEKEEVPEEVYGPLTPDGNLTLVDDYGTLEAGGKQFITVVSKSGNYFYIIIDRDDKGTETVHFLNMVDEADLLKLMDDEEVKQYMEATTEKEEPTEAPAVEEEPTETEAEPEAVPEEPKKKSATGYLALMFLVGIGAVAGYVFIMKKKKGDSKKKPTVDPDEDYDEDEDYLAGMDEDDEEIIDPDIDEEMDMPEDEESEE